ncbi:MAG: aldo/keto reductase [Halanaerobiaceae bacterium]
MRNEIIEEFKIAEDGVDPSEVPQRTLYSGDQIPAIGLGTFGSDKYTAQEIANAVLGAACVGYRHFDCAAVYNNENLIGESLQKMFQGGLSREELWVTSKLWNDSHGKGNVIPACKKSLKDLKLDYLDLYLVHWPFPNHHEPGVDEDWRDPDAVPYIHEQYMETWFQMEKLVERGLVRNIGTSNMTVPKLELLLRDANIKPVCNQMELHPHFQQPELFAFCQQNDILPVGFSPIGSPSRPDRDRTENDTVDIEDPVIVEIAEKHGVHPAVICVKWAQQRGQIPIPFSIYRDKYLSNLKAVVEDPLTEKEMEAISGIDKNCRLIKGQVFLWEGARDWRDLWDPNGKIPGRDH